MQKIKRKKNDNTSCAGQGSVHLQSTSSLVSNQNDMFTCRNDTKESSPFINENNSWLHDLITLSATRSNITPSSSPFVHDLNYCSFNKTTSPNSTAIDLHSSSIYNINVASEHLTVHSDHHSSSSRPDESSSLFKQSNNSQNQIDETISTDTITSSFDNHVSYDLTYNYTFEYGSAIDRDDYLDNISFETLKSIQMVSYDDDVKSNDNIYEQNTNNSNACKHFNIVPRYDSQDSMISYDTNYDIGHYDDMIYRRNIQNIDIPSLDANYVQLNEFCIQNIHAPSPEIKYESELITNFVEPYFSSMCIESESILCLIQKAIQDSNHIFESLHHDEHLYPDDAILSVHYREHDSLSSCNNIPLDKFSHIEIQSENLRKKRPRTRKITKDEIITFQRYLILVQLIILTVIISYIINPNIWIKSYNKMATKMFFLMSRHSFLQWKSNHSEKIQSYTPTGPLSTSSKICNNKPQHELSFSVSMEDNDSKQALEMYKTEENRIVRKVHHMISVDLEEIEFSNGTFSSVYYWDYIYYEFDLNGDTTTVTKTKNRQLTYDNNFD